jgi:translocation protein SEC63
MKVDAVAEEEEGSDVDDDISEPDEDSIAGQMALMKGQPVRRREDDDDESDEVDSDEESETDSDSDSSSDSDSDSDSD